MNGCVVFCFPLFERIAQSWKGFPHMKRARTSMSFFLGVWLVVLMAGYKASHTSVFAAGGQSSCVECDYCEIFSIWWSPMYNEDDGYVYPGSGQPAPMGGIGPQLDGSWPLYGTGCNGDVRYEYDPPVTVNLVKYSSASFECIITIAPPPRGFYSCSGGQGATPLNVNQNQSYCAWQGQ